MYIKKFYIKSYVIISIKLSEKERMFFILNDKRMEINEFYFIYSNYVIIQKMFCVIKRYKDVFKEIRKRNKTWELLGNSYTEIIIKKL